MPEDTTYAGWRVVSVDASGGVLLDGPGGDRRRVWFGESAALVERDILKARVKKLEATVEADDLAFAELDDVPELNTRNYNEDQVIELSAAFCDAHLLMKQAREAAEQQGNAGTYSERGLALVDPVSAEPVAEGE